MDGTFPASTKITVVDPADGTVLKHQKAKFSAISGSGKTISSMLIGRLTRLTSSGSDTFTGDAYGIELDFHHQVDAFGSDAEFTK